MCLPNEGALQDGVIVRVGRDNFQSARDRNDGGEGANLVGDLCCLADIETAFELELFREFGEDGFAGQGKAFALPGRLNAPMGIPRPADCGKEDVGVKDNARSPIHDSCKRSSTNASR